MRETDKQYAEFLETLLIEELIKEFNVNCKLIFIGKKRYGGSHLTTYYFKDDLGITWERDVSDRQHFALAAQNPKMRKRL